jgi:hypothetical protein
MIFSRTRTYLTLLAALTISFLTIGTEHFPFFGVSISAIILATLFFINIPKKTPTSYLWLCISILLASMITLRSNMIYLIIIHLALFYSLSFLLSPIKDRFRSFLIPVLPFFNMVMLMTSPMPEVDWRTKQEKGAPSFLQKITQQAEGVKNLPSILLGSVVALVVLGVTLPVLADANPIFRDLLNNLFGNFFEWLFDTLIYWLERIFDPITWLRGGATVVLFAMFLKVPSMQQKYDDLEIARDVPQIDRFVSFWIPKVAIGLALTLFIGTQLRLYTADPDVLRELNLTLSDKTTEIFWQLIWVILVVGSVLYYETVHKLKILGMSLTSWLILCLVGLSAFAFYSDVTYIQGYGLTHIRLWALYGIFLSVVFIAALIYRLAIHRKDIEILQGVMAVAALGLFVIGVINFDQLIFAYNRHFYNGGYGDEAVGVYSSDLREIDQIFENYGENPDDVIDYGESLREEDRVDRTEEIVEKYDSQYQLRTFNLAEWFQYQNVKDVDFDKVEEDLEVIRDQELF